jgi:hypothetical protein
VGSEIVDVKMRWDFVGVGLGERAWSLVMDESTLVRQIR